jgi:4-amino-4-deoxy-L-arabinose transferase-like glycosyltransferase
VSGLSRTRGEEIGIAALAVLPLLPFLDAAVSIDAPVFLAVTRQILAHPFDPFGFTMIWDPTSPEVAHFNQNPPLLSYYFAPFVAAFGERETVLHAVLLPFPAIAGLSLLGIARRVTPDGFAPTLLFITTPAFVVLASTLMLDVPMLAAMLFAVYALLRGRESAGLGWPIAAGLAAAVAGLTKYVGFSVVPLLGAGVALLYTRRIGPGLAMLGVPVAVLVGWGAWTAHLYGTPHFAGGTSLIGDKDLDPRHLWNQLASVPVYFGGALVFPIWFWGRALVTRSGGTEAAVVGVLLGAAAIQWALPDGQPPRRGALETPEAIFAALSCAGAIVVWWMALRPARLRAGAEDRFLALWLAGFILFSVAVNWHVNAADALLAGAPALLLVYRSPKLAPARAPAMIGAGVSLVFALFLSQAEARQAEAYRESAASIVTEIGDAPGARWFVGHWGLQYYLEREGFEAVSPLHFGESPIAPDDWIVSSRNLTQIDVSATLRRFRVRPVWSWTSSWSWPLRTNNPDAGAGFYSHHVGFVPYAWDDGPIEEVSLGRILSERR